MKMGKNILKGKKVVENEILEFDLISLQVILPEEKIRRGLKSIFLEFNILGVDTKKETLVVYTTTTTTTTFMKLFCQMQDRYLV